MDRFGTDRLFAGSIPELYESYLVPPIFEPYAADLANRVAVLNPSRVLETAAGTGVVTRALAYALPTHADIAPPAVPAVITGTAMTLFFSATACVTGAPCTSGNKKPSITKHDNSSLVMLGQVKNFIIIG